MKYLSPFKIPINKANHQFEKIPSFLPAGKPQTNPPGELQPFVASCALLDLINVRNLSFLLSHALGCPLCVGTLLTGLRSFPAMHDRCTWGIYWNQGYRSFAGSRASDSIARILAMEGFQRWKKTDFTNLAFK